MAEGNSVEHVVVLYAAEIDDATISCIKCCWHNTPLACCCKPKDEPDDGSGDE